MLPSESHARQSRFRGRNLDHTKRRRFQPSTAEPLENRQLLAFTPIGPLPDLVVDGIAGPIAAYGGRLGVTVEVRNLGTSMGQVEPLALQPGSPSQADAPPSTVGVYLTTNRHATTIGRRAVKLGDIEVPTVLQNGQLTLTGSVPMPPVQPIGFPGSGGRVYVLFRADNARSVADADRTNNIDRAPEAVTITAPLPDLAVIGLDLPTTMQPGDVIQPNIKIANYGSVDPALQGPVPVYLVASSDRNFGPADVVVAQYEIDSLPPLSEVPVSRTVLGDVNVDDPINVALLNTTILGTSTVQLPNGNEYFLGVIIDPFNTIRELNEIAGPLSNELRDVRRVGPPIENFPPAGTLGDPAPLGNVFPIPPYGIPPVAPFPAPPVTTTTAAVESDGDEVRTVSTARVSRRREALIRNAARKSALKPWARGPLGLNR